MQRIKVFKYLTIFFLFLTVILTLTNVSVPDECEKCAQEGYFPGPYLFTIALQIIHEKMGFRCPVQIDPLININDFVGTQARRCNNPAIIPLETIFASILFGIFWGSEKMGKVITPIRILIGIGLLLLVLILSSYLFGFF